MNRIRLVLNAMRELGFAPLVLYARYQLGVRIGWYRLQTRVERLPGGDYPLALNLLPLPEPETLAEMLDGSKEALLQEADEIVAGKVRLFGAHPVALQLTPPVPLRHWTFYETAGNLINGQPDSQDIKFTWEPARFGWVFTLARAYRLSKNERYSQAFWEFTETFWQANPAYLGPHWLSAQEVALRLIAWVFAGQVMADSFHSTPERKRCLAQAIATHATRIPPTIVYAQAQNNNHLLVEAAGLYTAGLALPDHPQAAVWRKQGWKWLVDGLRNQINADGAYVQHSANYHRLMLQIVLWVRALADGCGERLPQDVSECLAAATAWLLALVQPENGHTPNLGPNDGANILPLATCPFEDYRPVLQAAGQAFLGYKPFVSGIWDEECLWLVVNPGNLHPAHNSSLKSTPAVLLNTTSQSWAYLRVVHFHSRPGHADQLHLDLWWRGLNLALDAGTYLYNAPPPWNNALKNSAVHNTLTVNGLDQMRSAGRFLFLDWAQGRLITHSESGGQQVVSGEHNGYRRMGINHRRTVTATSTGGWLVHDQVFPSDVERALQVAPFNFRLHWLLPDYAWMIEGQVLHLTTPLGKVRLQVRLEGASGADRLPSITLARAGERIYGDGQVEPTWGWVSPTYGVKHPALSFSFSLSSGLPFELVSEWILPGEVN